ncbi:MAG: transglycosylase SLT domain-containing protein [Bacteroidota bacterium]
MMTKMGVWTRMVFVAVLFICSGSKSLFAHNEVDSIPIFPDLVYEYRIAELDDKTPIELEYNARVRRYIDVYTIERRDHLARIIGLAQLYFPMFEEALDRYELPLELKYLAIVESALDPSAVSSSGAVGLWQFKLNTSRMFDLEVTSYVDERRDPYKSTEAACKYLAYLYRIFDDWQLALAAYNGGPGEVQRAIQRSGGKRDFWELLPYLPAQTQGYVPAFIAVNYVMSFYSQHNIHMEASPYVHLQVDTLHLHQGVSFDRISQAIEEPVPLLQFLNPTYRRDYISPTQKPAVLTLPKQKINVFLEHQENILNKETSVASFASHATIDMPGDTIGKIALVHRVRKGEYYHKIAMNYGCTVEDIWSWNRLTTNDLKVGQLLTLWVDQERADKMRRQKELQEINRKLNRTNDRFIYYTVQEGDTIWSIASKFRCESIDELKEENQIQDENDLKPGTRLKIYLTK